MKLYTYAVRIQQVFIKSGLISKWNFLLVQLCFKDRTDTGHDKEQEREKEKKRKEMGKDILELVSECMVE